MYGSFLWYFAKYGYDYEKKFYDKLGQLEWGKVLKGKVSVYFFLQVLLHEFVHVYQ